MSILVLKYKSLEIPHNKKKLKIEFSIFWIHIMYEGHVYLFNLLRRFRDQYLQQKIPKTQIIFKEYGPQG